MIDPQTVEKTTWWLGETKGFWIQTGAFLLSAFGALWIVLSREKSERRRATVECVLHFNRDEDTRKAKKDFLKLVEADHANIAQFLNDKDSPEFQCIIRILNMHEFVCCGIRGRAYDEKLYKRMQCSVVIRDWDGLSGFVQEFRNSKRNLARFRDIDVDTFYLDFQCIADKWKKHPLKKPRFSWWPF